MVGAMVRGGKDQGSDDEDVFSLFDLINGFVLFVYSVLFIVLGMYGMAYV